MKYTPKLTGGIYVESYERGEHTYGEPTVMNYLAPAKLTIGDYCSIADGVEILLGGEHRTDFVSTFPFTLRRPFLTEAEGYPGTNGDVAIGHDVFIGRGAKILSGVTIHTGAVIGAGAVVSKDVMHYCVAVGNPARVVKKRLTDDQIWKMLQIEWWNWDEERVKKYSHLLQSENIDYFIEAVKNDVLPLH